MSVLKICNVIDLHTAKVLDKLNVEFIGIHMINEFKTYKLKLLQRCISELKYTIPVVVTSVKKIDYLRDLSTFNIPYLQLHAYINRDELKEIKNLLPDSSIICVVNISPTSDTNEILSYINNIKNLIDFILFDKPYVNRGKDPINYKLLYEILNNDNFPKHTRYFIGGGLTINNVIKYLELHPYGIDIQTGVEKSDGVKDFNKIKTLLKIMDRVETINL